MSIVASNLGFVPIKRIKSLSSIPLIDELKIYTQQQIAFALEGKNIDHYNIDEKVYPDVAAFITTTLNNEES